MASTRAGFVRALSGEGLDDACFALLADRAVAPDHALPDTGVGMEWERRLSAPFIVGADYGTRATTFVALDARGFRLIERNFGPCGVRGEERRFEG